MTTTGSDGCLVSRSGESDESTWRTSVLSDVTRSTASPPFTRRSSKTQRAYYVIVISITVILGAVLCSLAMLPRVQLFVSACNGRPISAAAPLTLAN